MFIGESSYPEVTALTENGPAQRFEQTFASPRRCRLTAGRQQWGAGRCGFERVRIWCF